MLCQRKVSLKAKFLIGLPYFYFCQCCFIQLPLISHLVDCCYNKKLIHAGFYSWFCQFRGFRYLIYMLLLLHLRNGEVCLLDLGGFRLFFYHHTSHTHLLSFSFLTEQQPPTYGTNVDNFQSFLDGRRVVLCLSLPECHCLTNLSDSAL